MSEIKRFDGYCENPGKGNYVLYTDYQALKREVEILQIKLTWAVEQRNHWLSAFSNKCGFKQKTLKKKIRDEDNFLKHAEEFR